ncbi:MAG: hypothetical protein WDM92_10230 [Caulobacteraceae bacterium]
MSKQKDAKDPKAKETTTNIYEVACQGALGYMILAPEGGTPQGFDCLALSVNAPKPGAKDTGGLYCRLPANADPVKALQPVVSKSAPGCTVAQARWMGEGSSEKFNQYEVGCSEGPAYVLQVPEAGSTHALTAVDCLRVRPAPASTSPRTRWPRSFPPWPPPSGRACQVTDGRYMGSLSNGSSYYEVACADGKSGYVFQVDASGKYMSALDCTRAGSIGGGCQLTAAGETSDNDTYSKLAKQIGYPCTVKTYRSMGLDAASGREVVELACSDHPDGAIALMPIDKGQKGEVYNCVRAEARQLKCTLTPPAATYAKLTTELAANGKTCQVTNARAVGVTAAGTDFVEAACAAARAT